MILNDIKNNLPEEGIRDQIKITDYSIRLRVKTKLGFRDLIQIRFSGRDGFDFVQTYTASILRDSHFGTFLRKLFGEEENYNKFELDRLIGVYCQIKIEHRQGTDGNTYANVTDIKQVDPPEEADNPLGSGYSETSEAAEAVFTEE